MSAILEPKVTFSQVLIVPSRSVTIGSMTESTELVEFARRLNELCDDMRVPPKGNARQTYVAKLFGVSQKGARKWLEAEGYPKLEMCKTIATWGGVQVEWLLTGRGNKSIYDSTPLNVEQDRRHYLPIDGASPETIRLIERLRALDSAGGSSPQLLRALAAILDVATPNAGAQGYPGLNKLEAE